MKWIGAHVSAAGGVENAPLNAKKIGAQAFALFTRNQRRWTCPPLKEKNIDQFRRNCESAGFVPDRIMPHSSYLINLGNPETGALEKSRVAFFDEMQRCWQLGLTYLNFHPGSHLGKSTEAECIERVAESINMTLSKTRGVSAIIENTAGQGSGIGHRFEQIASIIEQVTYKNRVGVCLDTCHLYAAGYDIKSREGFAHTFETFDEVVGFEFLKGMHLNDSKKEIGSRVDRHESIGKGTMGIDPFVHIMNDRRFDNMPLILETPDSTLWAEEIKLLYSLM